MRYSAWWLVGVISLVMVGCGKSDTASQSRTTEKEKTRTANTKTDVPSKTTDVKPKVLPVVHAKTPEEAVTKFFGALRDGDPDTIHVLLTQKAREETHKYSMPIYQSTNPNAKFSVGEVTYLDNKTGAHVQGVWIPPSPNGIGKPLHVIWILRQEKSEWRIAGLAVRLNEQGGPVFNFEDGEALKRQQRVAQAYEESGGEIDAPTQPPQPTERTAARELPSRQ